MHQAKVVIAILIFLAGTAFSQTEGRYPNKTLKDSIFVKGDFIKIPELIFGYSYPMRPGTIDSLKPVVAFL